MCISYRSVKSLLYTAHMHEMYPYTRLFVLLGVSLVILVVCGLFVRKLTAPDTIDVRVPLTKEEKINLIMEQPDESATTSASNAAAKIQLIREQPDDSISPRNTMSTLPDVASRPAQEVDEENEAKLKLIQQQPDDSL